MQMKLVKKLNIIFGAGEIGEKVDARKKSRNVIWGEEGEERG